MNEFKGTPGPWTIGAMESGQVAVDGLNGEEVTGWLDPHDGHLISAACDLLQCQTMGAQLNTPDFLDWIADRLVHVYGEDPGIDFVLSLRDRACIGRVAVAKALGEKP